MLVVSLLTGVKKTLRIELTIVFFVTVFLMCLPIFALLSITNISALSNNSPQPVARGVYLYSGPYYPGDLYDFGNCTFWVAMRRSEIGEPIPNSWGNAETWAIRAQIDGFKVDHTPTQFSIMQVPNVDNGLGHVAFVEKVDPDGDWLISEMNVIGFDEVDFKTMPSSDSLSYNFIHEK